MTKTITMNAEEAKKVLFVLTLLYNKCEKQWFETPKEQLTKAFKDKLDYLTEAKIYMEKAFAETNLRELIGNE